LVQIELVNLKHRGSRSEQTIIEQLNDEDVPVPVLSAALYQRFTSRGAAGFEDKVLSAMRFGFGGHLEKPVAKMS